MSTTTVTARARVRTTDGRLYDASVTLDRRWAHLEGVHRLSRHGDGYAATAVSDLTIPARRLAWIRWGAAEAAL